MNLNQIADAEKFACRAIRAVRPFVDRGPDRDALARAEFILAEARHFAVCWAEVRSRNDSKEIDDEQAKHQRTALIQRLTTSVAPDRL